MLGQVLLDRYRIDVLLGQGATSDVFKAFDLVLERYVAVKLLTRAVDANDPAFNRFLREARLTSRLSHPNIVSLFDFGVFNETQPFLVTEFLDGPTLQDILDKDSKLETARALPIFRQIADGLGHAHAAGIIHRDVKPSNMVLVSNVDTDFVKIIDFGFVRVISPGQEMQKLTHEDGILGTAFYMSPEQCEGKPAEECSDIYSLGCLMYECLSSRVPICGDNLLVTLNMHMHAEVVPLSQADEGLEIPPDLEALVMSCLEKKPENRPQSMKQVVSLLVQCGSKSSSGYTSLSALGGDSGAVPGGESQSKSSSALSSSSQNREGLSTSVNSRGETFETEPSVGLSSGSAVALAAKRNQFARVALLGVAGLALAGSVVFAFNKPAQIKELVNNTADIIASKSNSPIQNDPAAPNNLTVIPSKSAAAKKAKTADDTKQQGKEVDRLASLAKECHSQGKCDEAVELLERSIQLSSKVFGPKSKETKERKKDLAVIELTLGMDKEAAALMSEINGTAVSSASSSSKSK